MFSTCETCSIASVLFRVHALMHSQTTYTNKFKTGNGVNRSWSSCFPGRVDCSWHWHVHQHGMLASLQHGCMTSKMARVICPALHCMHHDVLCPCQFNGLYTIVHKIHGGSFPIPCARRGIVMFALSLGCLAAPGLRVAEQQGWRPPAHPRVLVVRMV